MLPVKVGTAGLRQSDALFYHIKHLPDASKNLMKEIDYRGKLLAIGAATRPRPIEDSYMPVFMAAKSYGETLSNLLNIPFYEFSHQEGHIEAGLWSIKREIEKAFMVLHISGGTTELLKVTTINNRYDIEIIGGTGDLSAGQFIDRIGIKLGLPFPAGPSIEKLALNWEGTTAIETPIAVQGNKVSFSGPETFLQRKIDNTVSNEEIAFSLLQCVGKSLYSLLKNTINNNPVEDLLIVGGVASNKQIRNTLNNLSNEFKINLHFGDIKYCSDNAVGISVLCLKNYLRRKQLDC
ncbi:N6-L-threonylcarbamoyladenine synthase [Alkaliphilus peptidifermentans DSM 18978]|uniref:N(6)-L-threonylcarbamoyladenine synthase n=2 Tax=Alkaliphilus TaxID=114627 RepID=A0A1G5KDN5_9FIRM|nr:N6-L-threonylcarbamoyladenine synthase [Alkaliphilus peptidifermentans DSM 18978]